MEFSFKLNIVCCQRRSVSPAAFGRLTRGEGRILPIPQVRGAPRTAPEENRGAGPLATIHRQPPDSARGDSGRPDAVPDV